MMVRALESRGEYFLHILSIWCLPKDLNRSSVSMLYEKHVECPPLISHYFGPFYASTPNDSRRYSMGVA